MRGVAMPKSLTKLSCSMVPLWTMPSLVSFEATSLMGTWPVTTPTRRASEARIMSTSFTPALSARYSVCPGNLNWPLWMVSLLIGAVTRTSTLVDARSWTAAEADGEFPPGGVVPNRVREGAQCRCRTRTGFITALTSRMSWMPKWRLTGTRSSNMRTSSKALRMHSEPMPWGSPQVRPMRTGLRFAMVRR